MVSVCVVSVRWILSWSCNTSWQANLSNKNALAAILRLCVPDGTFVYSFQF